ncbi:transcriptional regulator of PTS [Pseudoalteromonas citrea]|uniref:Transcriptional regulator of PTS n=1 Tax=Pseudoalteromonas citrea TaxID=43655 RepID=A0AAD4AGU8_9GAMM|nr:ROK family transcriptional regulator [Pseudoalteromonas citrea]KAF7768771.1 transcriptional regulator of PTS [Pseudoalteromonas citrea]
MKGSNAKQSKLLNLRLVLSQIVTLGPLSRADIARNTKLTKQTITNIVDALLTHNLVSETGIKKVAGAGKPSTMLCLNPNAGYTLAIRIIEGEYEIGLFKLNGHCINKSSHTSQATTLIQDICAYSEQLLHDSSIGKSSILGAGLIVQNNQLAPLDAHQFAKDIQTTLATEIRLPVALSNCAAACASYQLLFGEARELDSFVYAHIGERIEAATVYERKVLLGQNGITGALGDLFITPDLTVKKSTPGRLNDFSSLGALRKILKQPQCSHQALIEQQNSDNKKIPLWLTQAQEPLRVAIHTIESLLNPQTIIIGGDTSDWLLDTLLSQLRPLIPSISQYGERKVIRLIKAPDVANIALKGCSTLPLQAALDPNSTNILEIAPLQELSELQTLIYTSSQ